MSSPATPVAPVEKDKSKRRSIQRFVSKIIKTGKSTKKTEPTEPSEPLTGPTQTPHEATSSSAAQAQSTPEQPSQTDAAPLETTAETGPKVATLSPGARLLAEKHGIDIPDDWPYATRPPAGERVEKPIRMRVRRYCHECQTAFGSEKICSNCSHKRCVDCPRSPPAKSDKKKSKTKYKAFDPYEGLTLPSKKPDGQDLVHRKIRQRVHYKCHKCEADFAGEKICGSCLHARCKKCHREPTRKPKPKVTEVKSKKQSKWTCSECQTPANTTKACGACGHTRCVDCSREISKRKKPVLVEDATSETDTKEDTGVGESLIDKVSSALAATSIAS